jgi:hypothetical protein
MYWFPPEELSNRKNCQTERIVKQKELSTRRIVKQKELSNRKNCQTERIVKQKELSTRKNCQTERIVNQKELSNRKNCQPIFLAVFLAISNILVNNNINLPPIGVVHRHPVLLAALQPLLAQLRATGTVERTGIGDQTTADNHVPQQRCHPGFQFSHDARPPIPLTPHLQ